MKNKYFTIYLTFFFCTLQMFAIAQEVEVYSVNNKTGNLHFYEKGNFMFSYLLSKAQKSSMQIGFSPFKHFSISGAYIRGDKNAHDSVLFYYDNIQSKQKNEFVFSVGSYYFFPINFDLKHRKREPLSFENKPGFLIDIKTGYSRSQIDHSFFYDRIALQNISVDLADNSSSVNYYTLYLQVGMHLKLKYAQIGMNLFFNRIKYQDIELTGLSYPEPILADINSIFPSQSVYNPMTINIEGQLGVRAVKFIYGGTFLNFKFLNSDLLRQGDAYIYSGLVFEFNAWTKKNNLASGN